MKKWIVPIIVAMALVFLAGLTGTLWLKTHKTIPQPVERVIPVKPLLASDISIPDLFYAINVQRANNGIFPLVEDPRLDASAADKCADMVANKYFAHVSPTGVSWVRFLQKDAGNYKAIGENLAINDATTNQITDVVDGWMNSPKHKENILNITAHYTNVGYAVCVGNGLIDPSNPTYSWPQSYVIVQHFAEY